MAARLVWDQVHAGSIPVTPTRRRPYRYREVCPILDIAHVDSHSTARRVGTVAAAWLRNSGGAVAVFQTAKPGSTPG